MKKTIDKVLGSALVALMAIMLVSVLWQVFSRYVLKEPSSVTDELARYLLIWIGVLGAAYASGQKLHIAIDILPQKLSGPNKEKMYILHNLLIMTFALCALVIGGSRLVYITQILNQHSPALNVPLSIVYLVIPISGIVVILYKTLEIINRKKLSHD
ncbi:MAG: TRAP transporter small permease [Cyclobacteriaceae bacterium]|nr:TRAP transporter small permease [Cyclobacteriaceae bacterium]